MTYIDLFKVIDDHFLTEEALARVQSFLSSQHQVEGWFKGELLFLLKSLRDNNRLEDWHSEYSPPEIGKKRIDFYVNLSDGPLYIELKSFYYGRQANATIDLATCFTALPKDVDKLADLRDGNKFSLVFVTPKPNPQLWQRALQKFQRKYLLCCRRTDMGRVSGSQLGGPRFPRRVASQHRGHGGAQAHARAVPRRRSDNDLGSRQHLTRRAGYEDGRFRLPGKAPVPGQDHDGRAQRHRHGDPAQREQDPQEQHLHRRQDDRGERPA